MSINKIILNNHFIIISIFILLFNGCFEWKNNKEIIKIEELLPGKPWGKVLPQMKPVKGVDGLKASDCGTCHQEIYNEWKTSTHSQALHDLQFQAELSKATSPAWLCLNCHIPVQNQREYIVLGLENGNFRTPVTIPNPEFDPGMREEGVTCATCHIHVTDSGDSVIIGANGNYDPPHPVIVDPKRLHNRCNDCHNAEYVLSKDLICYFQTGKETKESPHLLESQKSCYNCHLPSIQRSIVKAELNKPIRNAHRHSFWGGAVPKNFELYKFIPQSGFRSSFQLMNIKVKDNNTITVSLKNTNAAHKLPTGDPERHIKVEMKIYNVKNELFQSEFIKIGQIWEWWPEAKLLKDNRLLPLEVRKFDIKLNENIEFTNFIDIEVFHIRLTEENAQHMKANYSQAGPRYKDKIRDLDKHYPFKTKIYTARWHPKSGISLEYKWKDTIKEYYPN